MLWGRNGTPAIGCDVAASCLDMVGSVEVPEERRLSVMVCDDISDCLYRNFI